MVQMGWYHLKPLTFQKQTKKLYIFSKHNEFDEKVEQFF